MPRWCFVALFGLLVCGCGPQGEIRTYTVPKETAPSAPEPEIPDAEKYRTLGAVIPADGNYSWFVKFAGPNAVVGTEKAGFESFVDSIVPVGGSNTPPKFTVPGGWTADAKSRATRIVTLRKGAAELVLSGPFGGSLLDNVNRWRKELGLRELRSDELAEAITTRKFGDVQGHTLDIAGPTFSGGMAGPTK